MNQENRFIYRITYTKGEMVKYISHLDFLRCVNRSFKRGKIPVKYSAGFNPHVLLNIALPCPVGVSSVCEMLDIELTEPMPEDEMAKRLSLALPVGIEVVRVQKRENLPDFFEISSARYTIEFKAETKIDVQKFFDEPVFMIEKKSKRGMKEVNLKDFIRKVQILNSDDDRYVIEIIADAGAKSNLKTELFMNAMQSYFDVKLSDIKTERKEIYY